MLHERGEEIGREYAARRATTPGHTFRWPEAIFKPVLAELRSMSDGRCSYCDAQHLGATGEAQVDHFKPKSRPEFYVLVCAWENLFLTCMACNKAKREQWAESLLRPDAEDFSFERYFAYDPRTHRVEVNAAATESDQQRARYTIDVFDLNRPDAVSARALVQRMSSRLGPEDRAELGYRFVHAAS